MLFFLKIKPWMGQKIEESFTGKSVTVTINIYFSLTRKWANRLKSLMKMEIMQIQKFQNDKSRIDPQP